jgi:hypothetical protein
MLWLLLLTLCARAAVHNFLRTRPNGTTVTEWFFGQKLRSLFATMLESVEILPRRAMG